MNHIQKLKRRLRKITRRVESVSIHEPAPIHPPAPLLRKQRSRLFFWKDNAVEASGSPEPQTPSSITLVLPTFEFETPRALSVPTVAGDVEERQPAVLYTPVAPPAPQALGTAVLAASPTLIAQPQPQPQPLAESYLSAIADEPSIDPSWGQAILEYAAEPIDVGTVRSRGDMAGAFGWPLTLDSPGVAHDVGGVVGSGVRVEANRLSVGVVSEEKRPSEDSGAAMSALARGSTAGQSLEIPDSVQESESGEDVGENTADSPSASSQEVTLPGVLQATANLDLGDPNDPQTVIHRRRQHPRQDISVLARSWETEVPATFLPRQRSQRTTGGMLHRPRPAGLRDAPQPFVSMSELVRDLKESDKALGAHWRNLTTQDTRNVEGAGDQGM